MINDCELRPLQQLSYSAAVAFCLRHSAYLASSSASNLRRVASVGFTCELLFVVGDVRLEDKIGHGSNPYYCATSGLELTYVTETFAASRAAEPPA
jgi:hypothetical protein